MAIRQIVTVSHMFLVNETDFNFGINNVVFVPDEIVVRCVSCYALTANHFIVRSDLAGGVSLFSAGCSANRPTFIMPNTSYPTHNANGQWNFALRDVGGNAYVTAGPIELYFQLEFIKH